ncbi:MAG TPA: alpha/beta hydrolase domain-containing protein [Acidimicrobiia bacterium]|nr:alpha/beta hydrolase domain-containing protein [Acidimicrobiia bacterium]
MRTVETGRGLSRTGVGTLAVISCAMLIGAVACSSGKSTESLAVTTTTTARPAGPSADLSHELTGGSGVFMGSATPTNLQAVGYVEHEYVAAGTASSYRAVGALGHNGRWKFVPATSAPYRTRVLVRRPADPARFSGTVVVEWLNVSGGVDADPEWTSLREEIIRRGDAWVGVSAQRIGVMGGRVLVSVPVPGAEAAGKGLKAIDPARYGSLEHPGDGFSYDIFTQVARAIRSGGGLGGLEPKRVIAAGESQSAFALVTYYNGVQPLTHAFDGFFVHSRGAIGLPLVAPGKYADIASSLSGTPSIFRTDQDAPVLDIQTETDVASILNSYAARQPDSARFRLWEVAGTAHADAHLVGSSAKYIDCGVPINNGPMHIVAKSALRALTTWLTNGQAPPIAPRIEVAPGANPQIERDPDGIALGGIRTPPVDVPVAALSGAPGPNPSTICLLLGSTKPFSAARLAQLYPSRAAYLQRYDADADAAIKAGFVLPEDRAALLGFAEPSRIAP